MWPLRDDVASGGGGGGGADLLMQRFLDMGPGARMERKQADAGSSSSCLMQVGVRACGGGPEGRYRRPHAAGLPRLRIDADRSISRLTDCLLQFAIWSTWTTPAPARAAGQPITLPGSKHQQASTLITPTVSCAAQVVLDEIDNALSEPSDALANADSCTSFLVAVVFPALTEYFLKHWVSHVNKLPLHPTSMLQGGCRRRRACSLPHCNLVPYRTVLYRSGRTSEGCCC